MEHVGLPYDVYSIVVHSSKVFFRFKETFCSFDVEDFHSERLKGGSKPTYG